MTGNVAGNITFADASAITSSRPFKAFYKADPNSVAFTATGAGTAQIKAGTTVQVEGAFVTFASATNITMPTLVAGTNYAIYVCTDGSIRADSNFTAPSGYTTANSRQIGGFHYAPGGNATGTSGGNTTPAINPFSFWDLKFKPACPDPRGMTLVGNSFWSDIYLLNINHITNGTSAFNVAYARGTTPPRIPTQYGGNGTATYGQFNWWDAGEVFLSYGKRLPRYQEFSALAYGTTENSSVGSDQNNTVLNAAYTSKWGVVQSTGVLWVWGSDMGGPFAGASWATTPSSRGQTYQLPNAVRVGGCWDYGSLSGSRAALWNVGPSYSDYSIGARGVCDHMILD